MEFQRFRFSGLTATENASADDRGGADSKLAPGQHKKAPLTIAVPDGKAHWLGANAVSGDLAATRLQVRLVQPKLSRKESYFSTAVAGHNVIRSSFTCHRHRRRPGSLQFRPFGGFRSQPKLRQPSLRRFRPMDRNIVIEYRNREPTMMGDC
jgi:hypothetical protein